MGNVDKRFLKKQEKFVEKIIRMEKMKKREDEQKRMLFEQIPTPSETDIPEICPSRSDNSSVNEEKSLSSAPPPKKRGRKNILDNNVAVALDATKLSNRKAAIVLTKTLKRVGCDPSEYNVNKSSISRLRKKSRKSEAQNLKRNFSVGGPLVVHWDGKILEDIASNKTVDRLPIIVSGKGIEQLLAISKLPFGTGRSIATPVL